MINLEQINENINGNNLSEENEMNNEIDKMKRKISKKRKINDIIYLLSLCAIGLSSYIYRLIFENKEYKFVKQGIGVL